MQRAERRGPAFRRFPALEANANDVWITYDDPNGFGTTVLPAIRVQHSPALGAAGTWTPEILVDGTASGLFTQTRSEIVATWPSDPGCLNDPPFPANPYPKLYAGMIEDRGSPAPGTAFDYVIACSIDGGATWSPLTTINSGIKPVTGPTTMNHVALAGDWVSNTVYAVWPDTRAPGTPATPVLRWASGF